MITQYGWYAKPNSLRTLRTYLKITLFITSTKNWCLLSFLTLFSSIVRGKRISLDWNEWMNECTNEWRYDFCYFHIRRTLTVWRTDGRMDSKKKSVRDRERATGYQDTINRKCRSKYLNERQQMNWRKKMNNAKLKRERKRPFDSEVACRSKHEIRAWEVECECEWVWE